MKSASRLRILNVLFILSLSVISTAIHFIDNYLNFKQYPQPDWITPIGIIRSWLIWTAFGAAGYVLYKKRRLWSSYLCLVIYSTCGISSLAHYLYGPLSNFSTKMNFFILTDGLTGLSILGFVFLSVVILKEPFERSAANA